MKVIRMVLGEKEVARITDGKFETLIVCDHPFAPNFKAWYDDCFYGIDNSKTFEQRFALAKKGYYFCFSKPSMRLVAEEICDKLN